LREAAGLRDSARSKTERAAGPNMVPIGVSVLGGVSCWLAGALS